MKITLLPRDEKSKQIDILLAYLNKWPNVPVSLTWFLPYTCIFRYQTMIKGCYMPNMYAMGPKRGHPFI